MGLLVETSVHLQVDVSQRLIPFLHCPAQSDPNRLKQRKGLEESYRLKGKDYI